MARGVWLTALTSLSLVACIRDFDRSLLEADCADCPIVDVAGSGVASCAVHRDGALFCWGANDFGQLGVPEAGARSDDPVRVPGSFEAVTMAGNSQVHTCAIDRAGAAFCWGSGGNGELGDGTRTSSGTPLAVAGGHRFTDIAAGGAVTCAVDDAGGLYCFGWTNLGRTGTGEGTSYLDVPTRVPIPKDVRSVAHFNVHGCAIDVDDGLWCWGETADGRRGVDGPYTPPQQVQPSERYRRVSVGTRHTCAIRNDATLWCWGDNSMGQLGSERSGGSAPAQVRGPTQWRAVAAGDEHTCGITTDGALYCWGNGADGKLGTLDEGIVSAPARVGDRSDWGNVGTGYRHTCASTRDGTLWCWGYGGHGAIGRAGTALVPTAVLLPDL